MRESEPPSGSPGVEDRQPDAEEGHFHQDDDRVDEHSPLLSPQRNEDEIQGRDLHGLSLDIAAGNGQSLEYSGLDSGKAKGSWQLLLLTLCMFGIQIAWSVEFSYGSPFLLSLGITKSLLALVWIAGPLSGTLVQPYVGVKSDQHRSRFGKRRPFIIGGALVTVSSLVALAWSKEIVSGFLSIFGVPETSQAVKNTAIAFAILMVYVLDFALNVISAAVRAFFVDSVSTAQQDTVNAWASRVSGFGGIIGYLFGYIDLTKHFGLVGSSQFKLLSVVTTLAMLSTVVVSCLSVKEKDSRTVQPQDNANKGVLSVFRVLWSSLHRLPTQIREVCRIQFFAWIGWFPFLFYITTYVGGIYMEPYLVEDPNMSSDAVDELWERATRIATFAMFIFAIITFLSSVIVPLMVVNSYKSFDADSHETSPPSVSHNRWSNTVGSAALKTTPNSTKLWSRLQERCRLPASLEIPGLTLRKTWMLSHVWFFILTWLTFIVSTTTGATILVALIGISFAITNWAPFALIAAEISKRDAARSHGRRSLAAEDGDISEEHEDTNDDTPQAGVVLGIHNVAISAPQVLATLISSVVFSFLQKPRGSVGDNSIAWMLRFGGFCALIAAWLTRRLEGKPANVSS